MKPMEAELIKMMDDQKSAVDRVAQMNIADEDLRTFVEHLAITCIFVSGAPEEWRYRNYYDLVLDLSPGPRRAPLELPEDVALGEMKQCFRNAWELAMDYPEKYTYVEGYAVYNFLPVPHAWVEDEDGRIIDPTWCNPEVKDHGSGSALYMGVAFDDSMLRILTIETGWASVFGGDGELDHRALRYGFTTDEGLIIAANGQEDM